MSIREIILRNAAKCEAWPRHKKLAGRMFLVRPYRE